MELAADMVDTDNASTSDESARPDIQTSLQKGELVVIAARPLMGKTSLAIALASDAAMVHQMPSLFLSFVSSTDQLMNALVASDSGISLQRITEGDLTVEEKAEVTDTIERLTKSPISIHPSPPITISELRTEVEKLKQEHDIGVLVIDYLQGIKGSESSDAPSIILQELKEMARELDIAVIALSQLEQSVDDRQFHRPTLADLGEWEEPAKEADRTLLLYRPQHYGYLIDRENRSTEDRVEVSLYRKDFPASYTVLGFQQESRRFDNLNALFFGSTFSSGKEATPDSKEGTR